MKGSAVRIRSSALENRLQMAVFCFSRIEQGIDFVPSLSQEVPARRSRGRCPRTRSERADRPGTCTVARASAAQSGTRSITCPMAANCSASSAPLGRGAAAHPRATSRSVSPKTGYATRSTRSAEASCPASSKPDRRRGRRVPALHRVRPRTQALHHQGLPVAHQRPDPPPARRHAARGPHPRARGAMVRRAAREAELEAKDARRPARDHGGRQKATPPPGDGAPALGP